VKINVEGEEKQHVQNPLLGEVAQMSTGLDSPSLMDVLACVMQERLRQDAKWGEQNHPNFAPHILNLTEDGTVTGITEMPLPQRFNYYGIPTKEDAKRDCEETFASGKGNWGHILIEEISESFGTMSEEKLEEELVQSAAVIVAWVQCIRRRRTK
jgi:hypothetical protein